MMHRDRQWTRYALVVLPLLLVGCAKDVEVVPSPTGLTFAVFDPSASPAQVPTPTDLAVDQTTGLLDVPVADATKKPAQAYFDAFLNTLNGYPATATAEVHFTGELDPATVNENNIVVLEMDPANATNVTPVTGLTYEYKALGTDGDGDGKNDSLVRIWNLAGWKRGYRYVFYLVSGAKGVKDKGGKQVHRSALFELATGPNPLCAWDQDKSWDSTTMSCATPAPGGKATGCCTFNYNGLLESTVKKAVRASAGEEMSTEDLEKLVKASVLEKATDFETLRRAFEQLLAIATQLKINKDDIAVLWSFKVVDMNQAVFNPAATPPQVPTPTDLIRDPSTGLLNIPQNPTASKAEQAFNDYLRTLNGYPMSSTGSLSFTGALDKTSVDKGVLVFAIDKTSSPPKAEKLDNVTVTYDEANNRLVVSRAGGLKHGTVHVMVAVGNEGGLKNADATYSAYPARTSLMHLTLSSSPLCDGFDAATATCKGDPTVSSFIDDPPGVTGGRTGKEKAALFETIRLAFDPLLTMITAADSSFKREDVRALWAFTTTSQAMVVVDPSSGQIPFPSDFLLDQTSGKVAIPAQPGESPEEKALREGLNTQDGFPTQATYFVPLAGNVDQASTDASKGGVLTLDISGLLPLPAPMTVTAENAAGALTFKPVAPLKEKSRYAVILTSKHKAGDLTSQGGLTDDKGRYVVPAPFTVLLRSADPVYDAATQKSLVSTVDGATAKLVEDARQAFKPLIDGAAALGVSREDIVGIWTMTTMSITETMQKLRALPYQALAALDANQPKLNGAMDTALTTWPALPPAKWLTAKTGVGGIVASGTFKSIWALSDTTGALEPDPTKYKPVDVPFILTIPSGAAPGQGWPLVIYVQSILQSKEEMLAIASDNAQRGLATISFDLPFHGERAWCVKDDECEGTGTCNTATGKCSTKLADKDGNGIVDASGNDKFIVLDNPFAIRDNLRQSVIDASALMRTVVLGGASGITGVGGGGLKFDLTKITVAGYSLGAVIATDWLAVEGNTVRAALNSPGLRVAEIFLAPNAGKSWDSYKQLVFGAQGITEGTLDAIQLVTTFQWILEPADPGNFGRHIKTELLADLVNAGNTVPPKDLMIQQAEKDEGVPVRFSDPLLKEIGITDTSKTFYLGQEHSFFKVGAPDATATQACRAQMAEFLASGTICTPAVSGGSYTGQCN